MDEAIKISLWVAKELSKYAGWAAWNAKDIEDRVRAGATKDGLDLLIQICEEALDE